MLRTNSVEYLNPPSHSVSRQSSMSSAIFSLVSTIIGGGVLSLPYAFFHTGLVCGVLFLVLIAIAADFSIYILIAASRRRKHALTYEEVAYSAFGQHARVVALVMLVILVYLAMVAYLILIRDLIGPELEWLTDTPSINEALSHMILVIITAALLPLCNSDNLHALRYTSGLSVVSVILLAVILCIRTVHPHHSQTETELASAPSSLPSAPLSLSTLLFPPSLSGLFSSVPIILCTFVCHFNVLPVHASLIEPTRRRVRVMIHWVIALCSLIYIVIATAGLLLAGQQVNANILNNFNSQDPLAGVARMGLLFTLICSFPLLVLPCRQVSHTLITGKGRRKMPIEEPDVLNSMPALAVSNAASPLLLETECSSNSTHHVDTYTDADLNVVTHGIEEEEEEEGDDGASTARSSASSLPATLCIVCSALLFALLIPSVATLWSILGCSISIILAFILPCACYLQIRRNKPFNIRQCAAWVLLVVSTMCLFLCTGSVVIMLSAT